MIVLDASALVELLLGTSLGRIIAERIALPEPGLHAPHLADVEVTQALRRYVLEGELDAGSAASAIDDLRALDVERHSHEPLLDRVWALRANLTAYDAVYVALAEALGTTLLTCAGQSEAKKSSYGITSGCETRQWDSMPDQPRPANTCAHSGHWRGHLRLRGMLLRQDGQSAGRAARWSRQSDDQKRS
jgi:predicted nucleic acid-binding protein